MGYMHINNLYKDQRVLAFKECYALEKIHGTSAHIRWSDGKLTFFSGGEKHDKFVELFDQVSLVEAFTVLGCQEVVIYGEAYGGKQQGMSHRYGKSLKFVVFDVQLEKKTWLPVPEAAEFVAKLCLEFIHFIKVSTDIASLDEQRDANSEQARRNGIVDDQHREGIVIRPLFEVCTSNGERIMAKHKRDDERETRTSRAVGDPAKLLVLEAADAIANEWVTMTRLEHVLDKLGNDIQIEKMPAVISAMVDDVMREGAGEILDSKPARSAIGKKTAVLFKSRLRLKLVKTLTS